MGCESRVGHGARTDVGAGPDAPLLSQEITELPDYNKISFKEQAPVPLEEVLPDASPQALDLLGQFLLYPPCQRISASKVGDPIALTLPTCAHGTQQVRVPQSL